MSLEIGCWKFELWWNMAGTEQEATRREDMIVVKPFYQEFIIDTLCSVNDKLYYDKSTGKGRFALGTYCFKYWAVEHFVV